MKCYIKNRIDEIRGLNDLFLGSMRNIHYIDVQTAQPSYFVTEYA